MAERRMISKAIVDSDAFLDMSVTARLLYFDLNIRADDDGFVNSPKKIMRMTGASLDDLKALCEKKFIIPFENGVIVIKHWRVHNYIRKDTYTETTYLEQKDMLELDKKGIYHLKQYTNDCLPEHVTSSSQERYETVPQVSIGKVSIDKNSIDKNNKRVDASRTNLGHKNNELDEMLDSYLIDGELREAFIDFIAMRKAKKRPLSPRALKMVINKLCELSNNETEKINILNQSILHNWDTVYAIKSDFNRVGANGVKLSDTEDHTLDGIL